jgi:elongation factor Ts
MKANATMGEKIEVRRIAVIEGFTSWTLPAPHKPRSTTTGWCTWLNLLRMQLKLVRISHSTLQHLRHSLCTREEVPAELIENERRIAEETAREEGKPEASLSKIIEGRVTGFVKEVSLIEQAFAKDAKKTVKQILDEAGTAVKAFHRFRVGQ